MVSSAPPTCAVSCSQHSQTQPRPLISRLGQDSCIFTAVANSKCGYDYSCLCNNQAYLAAAHTCVLTLCDTADQQLWAAYGNQQCASMMLDFRTILLRVCHILIYVLNRCRRIQCVFRCGDYLKHSRSCYGYRSTNRGGLPIVGPIHIRCDYLNHSDERECGRHRDRRGSLGCEHSKRSHIVKCISK
jgi:hypothetical protein